MHGCIDDATRLAYVEVLADEKAVTAVGFLHRGPALPPARPSAPVLSGVTQSLRPVE